MTNKKIIQIEFMKCNVCNIMTLHNVKLDYYTRKTESIDCLKCKHGDDYNIFESTYDGGVRFRLGL